MIEGHVNGFVKEKVETWEQQKQTFFFIPVKVFFYTGDPLIEGHINGFVKEKVETWEQQKQTFFEYSNFFFQSLYLTGVCYMEFVFL